MIAISMRRIVAAACVLAGVSASAQMPDKTAKPVAGADAAARFGAREGIQGISLSPDATHVAIIVPTKGAGTTVLVADLVKGGEAKAILSASGNPDRLTSCHWPNATRLVCGIYAIVDSGQGRLGFTRLFAVDADGGHLKMLSADGNSRSLGIMQEGGTVIDWSANDGSVLMTRQFIPEQTIGTMLASSRAGLGVEVVDTSTFQRRTVEEPKPNVSDYIADGRGTVRIMGVAARSEGGYSKGRTTYFFRRKGDRAWQKLGDVVADTNGEGETGFDPYAVDPDLDVAYGFERIDGRTALYRMALDGSGRKELMLARPDVDVDGLIRIGRQRRVVGASYVTDRRATTFFDPELLRLRAALAKALPGDLQMSFVDASADERKLLLFVGSDTNAGRYYLYDKDSRHLAEVLASRPQLDGIALATQKAITFKAADGTMIPAYLTLPPGSDGKGLPAIVMPHGGPGARDEWGFDWLSQFFANRGYAVLQPNFRGSTGYGDSWFQKNGFQSWRIAIGDIDDAGRYLLSSGISAPGKLGIFGWSYGGYAALQSSVLDPYLFKAIVAVAPVTDLATLRGEAANYSNALMVDKFIGHGPEVDRGSPAQNIGSIKAPVLLFHGDLDQNVGVGESRMMVARLRAAGKPVDYVEYKGLDHQLDDSAVRAEMLGKSDAFFRKAFGS